MNHQTSMFSHQTQIPRSPFASTLTLVFHAALGLAVVIVTAIPSIPKAHKNEQLTFIMAEALPDLRFDVPPAPVPVPKPVVEIPRPEPPKAFEAPAIEKPAPVPMPPPPAPAKKAIEPPREVPVPTPLVNVGAFDKPATATKVEPKAQVQVAEFETRKAEAALVRRELQSLDVFDKATDSKSAPPRAMVSDSGFNPEGRTSNTQRPALTTALAGFSPDLTPKPAANAPRATGAPGDSGFTTNAARRPAPAPPVTTQAPGFAETPAAPKPAPQAPPPPRADRPVEVVYKPSPAYTDEARAQRVEGEVVLEVEFTAEGKVRVLRVVRGLGFGLDEMAQRAAEQIRFKPATSKGAPVDFRANLTIVFRLT